MPVTNEANIRPSSNNMNLHTFKEPVPALCVLILNKSKDDGYHLLVAINSNRCQYCPLYFPVKNVPSIHRTGRQYINALTHAPRQKKARSRNPSPPSKLGTM